MDYPSPAAKINTQGEIDISDAYATGIGDWDKISIAYGYSDHPPGTDGKIAAEKILTEANKNGFQFISDRDARAAGGVHPYAHLWDNGKNAVDELKNVMAVREKALSKFGEKNIRPGAPMALLEDVLVPIYLFHRYQVEAVTKLIGGLNYTYALRGDKQLITQALPKSEQLKALQAVVNCIDPKVLMLPESISKLIPPRPAGYNFTKELFKKRTGLAFDILSPAETAADLPISFLLNTERMNRMAVYKFQNDGLGLNEMLELLISKTWKSTRLQGIEGLIQMQTEQVLLTYLLLTSIDDNSSFLTKSILQKILSDLKVFVESKKKAPADEIYTGHLLLALERIKSPEKAKPTMHAIIPPGAPIGCDY
jgi:hypothetical protein